MNNKSLLEFYLDDIDNVEENALSEEIISAEEDAGKEFGYIIKAKWMGDDDTYTYFNKYKFDAQDDASTLNDDLWDFQVSSDCIMSEEETNEILDDLKDQWDAMGQYMKKEEHISFDSVFEVKKVIKQVIYKIDENLNESQSQEIGDYYRKFFDLYGVDLDELVYGEDGFMKSCYPNGFPDFAGDVIYSEKYWNEFEKWLKDTKGIELHEELTEAASSSNKKCKCPACHSDNTTLIDTKETSDPADMDGKTGVEILTTDTYKCNSCGKNFANYKQSINYEWTELVQSPNFEESQEALQTFANSFIDIFCYNLEESIRDYLTGEKEKGIDDIFDWIKLSKKDALKWGLHYRDYYKVGGDGGYTEKERQGIVNEYDKDFAYEDLSDTDSANVFLNVLEDVINNDYFWNDRIWDPSSLGILKTSENLTKLKEFRQICKNTLQQTLSNLQDIYKKINLGRLNNYTFYE